MRAQVSLIPNESKKLIAKAVAGLDEVKTALKDGIVAMHPSSSTLFLAEEILGKTPETEVWMCGAVTPRAAGGDDAVKVWMTTGAQLRQRSGQNRDDDRSTVAAAVQLSPSTPRYPV